ncbi:hypothetical protein [Streptomyces sp. G1]|uniref:hypothetical protein n=1 Tax=Streptomyces sp. G1 TaxID=361572 RepID=UPI00202DE278|nr:hypothetical protein [Streptomyces sp. G1]MCM1972988.1 hypothetical protein [Streptomyces sp. G1]
MSEVSQATAASVVAQQTQQVDRNGSQYQNTGYHQTGATTNYHHTDVEATVDTDE